MPILYLLLSIVLFGCNGFFESDEHKKEAVKEWAARYKEAFNQKDIETMINMLDDNVSYLNKEKSINLEGREAIKNSVVTLFEENKDLSIDIFLSDFEYRKNGVICVRGFIQLHRKDAPIEESLFEAEYEKRDGKWFLIKMVEFTREAPPVNFEQLKEFEWLIGDWVSDEGLPSIRSSWDWLLNSNFIVHTFETNVENIGGLEIFGWDPEKKVLRLWIFYNDGGFGSGEVEHDQNRWIFTIESLLAEGQTVSSVNVIHKIDENTYTWESTGRVVDGESLPDIKPIKIKRVK